MNSGNKKKTMKNTISIILHRVISPNFFKRECSNRMTSYNYVHPFDLILEVRVC